jgi:hypothetical protein
MASSRSADGRRAGPGRPGRRRNARTVEADLRVDSWTVVTQVHQRAAPATVTDNRTSEWACRSALSTTAVISVAERRASPITATAGPSGVASEQLAARKPPIAASRLRGAPRDLAPHRRVGAVPQAH